MRSSARETQFQMIGAKAPLILVPSHVNSMGPYNFILDSGASHCLISPELAANIGIHSESHEEAFGAGGTVQLPLACVHSLAVGSAQQENTQVLITHDLERIGAALKLTVDGAIGLSFMKDFRMTIDYQRKILSFARPSDGRDKTSHSASSIPFTLTPAEQVILLQAFVNGEGPFQFALDTAAGRSVISAHLADRVNVLSEKEVMGAGVGGQIPMSRAKLSSLTVGDATVEDHLVVIGGFMDEISTAAGAKIDGVIGNNFLSRFYVTLDYPQRQLWLAVSQPL